MFHPVQTRPSPHRRKPPRAEPNLRKSAPLTLPAMAVTAWGHPPLLTEVLWVLRAPDLSSPAPTGPIPAILNPTWYLTKRHLLHPGPEYKFSLVEGIERSRRPTPIAHIYPWAQGRREILAKPLPRGLLVPFLGTDHACFGGERGPRATSWQHSIN